MTDSQSPTPVSLGGFQNEQGDSNRPGLRYLELPDDSHYCTGARGWNGSTIQILPATRDHMVLPLSIDIEAAANSCEGFTTALGRVRGPWFRLSPARAAS